MSHKPEFSEMTLVEHLDELRTRLIISLVAVVVCCIAGWFAGPKILEVLISQVGHVQVIGVTDGIKIRLKLACWCGLLIASPIVLGELWMFVAPGLYSNEKRYVVPSIIASYILFFGGGAFGTYTLPFTIKILESFNTSNMRPDYSIDYFISFAGGFILSFAAVFQLPIVIVALAGLGIVSYETLAANRRVAFIVGLIISAFMTPGDPFSMFIIVTPLYLLFEISLMVIRFMKKQSLKGYETADGK